MTEQTRNCSVCGRTIPQLEDLGDWKPELRTHQGIEKCPKCIFEYEVEAVETETEEQNNDRQETNSDTGVQPGTQQWKEKIAAPVRQQ